MTLPSRPSPATLTIQGLDPELVAWLNREARTNRVSASAIAKGMLIDAITDELDRERRPVGKA